MGIVLRAVCFLAATGAIWTGDAWLTEVVAPRQSAPQAIAALNGGDEIAERLRVSQRFRDLTNVSASALTGGAFLLCFATWFGKPRINYIAKERR
jgi:hypothetical protein